MILENETEVRHTTPAQLHVPFAQYEKLRRENQELRKALEIYATPDNWRQKDLRTGQFDWFLRGNAGWDIAQRALTRAGS